MFSEIRAVFSRRYLLQNTAMEVFMANRSKPKCQLQPLKLCFSCSSSLKGYLSLFHSIRHVQLSRPGHSEESGLQSSSGGSGHQLWTPTSQVGRICQKENEFSRVKYSWYCNSSSVTSSVLCVRASVQPGLQQSHLKSHCSSYWSGCALTLTELT